MPNLQKQLTSDIAIRLAAGWRELLTDEVLATVVGVELDVLRGWLEKNEDVVIVRSFKTGKQDTNGNEVIDRRTETIGLNDLRTKEQQRLEYEYLAKHAKLIEESDAKTAIKAIQWRLERAIPERYGKD
ncbi:hypothetical protein LCGC14_2344790, partial [marine sediment metagenome]